MNQKIIERIKKMFALANNAGSTEGEADNAMRMATKLLEKHNLSMVDLHTQEEVGLKFNTGETTPWIRTVYSSVSRLYGCTYFYDPAQKINFIVGTGSDRITAAIVIQYLIEDIKKAGKGKGAAFRNGAAQALSATCFNISSERNLSNETTATGIVLADIYKTKTQLAQEFMDKNLNLSSGRRSSTKSSSEGRNYGKGLSPNARMSNKVAIG